MPDELDYGKAYVTLKVNSVAVPFSNFRYRIATNAEEIHLPSKWSAGWHHLPPQFTANMTLYATSGVPALVHEAQLSRSEVTIEVSDKEEDSPDAGQDNLGFTQITLSKGRIIDAAGEGFNGRDMVSLVVTCRFNRVDIQGKGTIA